MADNADALDEPEYLAAASVLSGIPAADIQIYVLTVIRPTGTMRVSSNSCCDPHTAAWLAAAAGELMLDHAMEDHVLTE